MLGSRIAVFILSTYIITSTSWWFLAVWADRSITTFGQAPFMILYGLGGLGPTIGAYISVLSKGSLVEQLIWAGVGVALVIGPIRPIRRIGPIDPRPHS